MNTPKNKIKVEIKYRIYLVVEGLLKQPIIPGYGHDKLKYDDSNSMEEAARLIEKAESYHEYVILPVTNTVPIQE